MERQDPQHANWVNNVKAPMAGAFSGCITRALTQPLDCSKVRLQLQVEPVANVGGARYSGTCHTLYAIFHDEGLRGLWKGHIPAQLLSVFYGLGQFAAYDQLNRAGRHVPMLKEHSNTRHFLCGGIAGAIGNTVSTPFDVVRTRIIAQDHGRGYISMTEVCVEKCRAFNLPREFLPKLIRSISFTFAGLEINLCERGSAGFVSWFRTVGLASSATYRHSILELQRGD